MKKLLKKLEGEVKEQEIKEELEEGENITEQEMMQLIIDEINHKTLNIVGAFDEKMIAYVREFANNLWYYEQDPTKPLYINISSHGGYASALLAILDILQDMKDLWGCKIITNCSGYAESCGFILWCFGDEREMGEFGELMVHEIAYNYDDKISGHERELKRTKKMQDKINKIIMMKTPLTKKQLNKFYKEGDKFIDREEALKLGLIVEKKDEGEEIEDK